MGIQLTRRSILKALGIGTVALALEPAKKMWFVPSTAPVGSRIERDDSLFFKEYDLKVRLAQEDLCDRRFDATIQAARAQKRAMYAQMDRDVADQVSALDRAYGQARGGGKIGVVDLNEGSEWSFENGTKIRFGKGGSLEYAHRDMELADSYVRNLKAASGLYTIEVSSLNDLVFSKS